MNSEACSAPDESKIMVPKLVEPSGESVASGQVTPKLDMRNGIPHITVPVINMISVPNSSTATANASHSIHSHVHGGQLPLSATTSLSNNVGASRTTPTTRTERQSKKSIEPRSTPKRGNFNKVNRKGKCADA